ncbi:MAG: YfhO family protein, partial [Flavobacterium sp.]|nr:YfhO family protein [Flavobacterium sp.]
QAEDYVKGMPTYWGDQPIVAAPAYIGAVVFFLAFLALFIDNRKIKYVFFGGAMIALVLSWGKNFPIVTNFFIDYIPLYDKFRAVSSIQVILELCFPILAMMGLQSFFQLDQTEQKKGLIQTTVLGVGTLLILFVFKGTFSFSAASDDYFIKNYGPSFVDALKADRKTMYSADLLRSGFFILLVAGFLWLFIKNKFAQKTTIIFIGLVMIFDLFLVDKKYVSEKDFVSKREIEIPFQATPVDLQILQDSSNYRVFEINGNLSSARASFFHKSIGGYHAAKPRRMQQLFDYQIAKNNLETLNFLNVKYLIQTDKEGKEFPIANPDANGNAWFVNQVQLVHTADEEMKALNKLDSKNVAVINSKEFKIRKTAFLKDSLASITLDSYQPNDLKYTSINSNDGLAVFSEMYYKNGWNAYIDGNKVEHLRANYVLRALPIPAGKHTIEFKFEPEVVKTGSTITLLSSIVMVLLLIGGIYFERKKGTQL